MSELHITVRYPGQGKPAYIEDSKTGQCQPIPYTYQEMLGFFMDYINDLDACIAQLEEEK